MVAPSMPQRDRQLTKLAIYGVLTYPFACVPFLYFYFRDLGIAIDQYMVMIAWYYWAMVLMEVPTGMFADRFGRRVSLIAGSLTLAAGFLVLYLGRSYPVFCAAEVVLGVGHSLLSGATTALVYDRLAVTGDEGRFLLTESRVHALRLLGTGGSFLVGGALAAAAGIGATILLTVALCGAGGVAAWLLAEPTRAPRPASAPPRPALLRAALRDLGDRRLLWILAYFVVLFGLLRFAFHTYQPYFEETVFDRTAPAATWLGLGVLFAALNLVAAPCSRWVPRLRRRFSYRALFAAMPAALCASFIVMGYIPGWLGVLLFFVHQVPFGLHWSLIQDYVNHRIAAESRATTLSILSFAGRVSFAAWLPLAGAVELAVGTPTTYAWIGWIGLGLTALCCNRWVAGRMLREPVPGVPAPEGPAPRP